MYALLSDVRVPVDCACRTHGIRHCRIILSAILLLWWSLWSGEPLAQPKLLAIPAGPVERVEATAKVDVFYVTNRKRNLGKSPDDTYSGDRGGPRFGRCTVEFEPIPIINQLAEKLPFYLRRETHAISLSEQAEPSVFWEQLVAEAKSTSSGSVVLFVHGYNYGFEKTCRMAAEMQRSLQGQARVVVFSWPSNGLASDYVRDQADVEWSVPLLAKLISQLGARIGRDNVQLVAHSLGSRGVVFALQRLGLEGAKLPVIERLVLLAPDFDTQSFVDLLPGILPLVGGITLYASGNDAPLKLSHQLSGYPRLGEAGEYLTVVEGVETIDVSSIGRYQVTGHEYFYFHPLVSADLVALLGAGASATERPRLQARIRDGLRYWQFAD